MEIIKSIIKSIFKRIFCKHEYVLFANVLRTRKKIAFGKEAKEYFETECETIIRCRKCGKEKKLVPYITLIDRKNGER